MGVAGWSSALPSSINDLTLLPRGCEWSSDPNGVLAEIIRNVTTGGKRYDNVMFDRLLLELSFHFPQSENADFYALYLAGRAADFYFVPDSDDMGTVLLIRLEEPNYLPKNTGTPGQLTDTMEMWFRWVMRASTEVAEEDIED